MIKLPTLTASRKRIHTATRNMRWSRRVSVIAITVLTLFIFPVGAAAEQDVLLVLDNSGSMKKNDPEFLATTAVREFIESLSSETHAGVLIFDQRVTLAVPLTVAEGPNKQLLLNSLDDINYRGQLTDSPAAVERAIYELKTNGREVADKYIVFMTDGIVDTGNAAADVEKTKWLREELAVDAADNEIQVLAVAFTENADFFLIQSLAKKTKGEYFRALTPADLSGVFSEIQTRISTPKPVVAEITPPAPEPTPAPQPQVESAEPLPSPVIEAPVTEDQPSESSDLLAQISPEDLEALKEISAIEGIPIEQLARELYGSGTEENDQPGVVVSRPGEPPMLVAAEEPPVMEEGLMLPLLFAAGCLLALLLLVVWFIRRKRNKADASVSEINESSAPVVNAPPAFLHDMSGMAVEPLVNLDAQTLMIGRVAGTPDEHLKYMVINVPTVGRRHALIKYKDKAYWVQDQGSVNGTYVNDKRLSGECQLRHGDRLRFHNAEFEFTQPDIADAGETMIAEALPGEATIVADATMLGTVAASGAAAAEIAAAGENAEVSKSDDGMFDEAPNVPEEAGVDETLDGSDDSRLDKPGVPDEFIEEEITSEPQTSIDDIFDVTGEDAVPVVLEEPDDDESEDITEMNPNNPATVVIPSGGVVAAPEGEIDQEFDAEASAFFDDITVGPVADAEESPDPTTTNFDVDDAQASDEPASTDAHDLDQAALDERLERARELAEADDAAPTQQVDASHFDTMLNMQAPPAEDPNDVTLDDFIETNSFKSPPTQAPDETSDDVEDVSLDKFIETSAMEADDVEETAIMDAPPGNDDGGVQDDDAADFFNIDDGSEDPTELK
ncbi:MAG: VWA domain-containing protein [Pseudomonadota bacterium]